MGMAPISLSYLRLRAPTAGLWYAVGRACLESSVWSRRFAHSCGTRLNPPKTVRPFWACPARVRRVSVQTVEAKLLILSIHTFVKICQDMSRYVKRRRNRQFGLDGLAACRVPGVSGSACLNHWAHWRLRIERSASTVCSFLKSHPGTSKCQLVSPKTALSESGVWPRRFGHWRVPVFLAPRAERVPRTCLCKPSRRN